MPKVGGASAFKFLLATFLGFSVVTIVLLSYYFLKNKNIPTVRNIIKEDLVFKSRDETYSLKDGEVVEIQGDPEKGGLSQLIVSGKITKKPFWDSGVDKMILPVSFSKLNGGSVSTEVVLGVESEDILVMFAKNGIIPENQVWVTFSVGELTPFLKSNYPVILILHFQRSSLLPSSMENCDSSCQKLVQEVNNFSPNNSILINSIKGESAVDRVPRTGPISSLIIYSKE